MSNRRFRRVVGRLRLRHVDDGAGHAADHHHRAGRLAGHQVFRHAHREEVRAIDVYTPELFHPVVWVGDGIVVLGESGGGDEVVDVSVGGDDIGDATVDRVRIGNVAVMSSDFGEGFLFQTGVFILELG